MKKHNLFDLEQAYNKYQVKGRTLVNHENATIKELFLEKGQDIPKHQFPLDVTFIFLEGTGLISIGDEMEHVKPFDVVLCPPNTVMSVKADEDSTLSFLNIKTPGLKSLEK